MGGCQSSYPGLTEDVLEELSTLTYLNKGEILYHVSRRNEKSIERFVEQSEVKGLAGGHPKVGLIKSMYVWLAPKITSFTGQDRKTLMKKFYSIAPQKLEEDYHHRFPKKVLIKKFGVLRNNPFQDRLFKVFSSHGDDCLSFEDLVDLCSAMSSECPTEVKAAWAFRIFDLDDDNQISHRDIQEILDRLTWDPNNRTNFLSKLEKAKIAEIILEETKLDNSGSIGMSEFKIIMSRLPEFKSAFYFRL